MRVQSLGRKNPWKIPWTEEHGKLQSMHPWGHKESDTTE